MIYGRDVLQPPADSGIDVLSLTSFRATGHTDDGGSISRRPPIDVLFTSEDAEDAQATLDQRGVEKIGIFTVSAAQGVLVGQRSFLTGQQANLVNDTDHTNHTPRIFSSEERRRFESLNLLSSGDGYAFFPDQHPQVKIDGHAAVLTAMEHDNYGAFLLRALPKIISLRELAIGDIRLIVPLNSWQRKILDSFGLQSESFVPFHRGTSYKADTLIVPSMRTSEFFIDDSTRVFFSETSERISFSRRGSIRHEKLYVSRLTQGRNKPDYRLFQNEHALIERLEADGFHIYEPEQHSFEEQVATFNAARIVVGPSGAGMFNTIFCKAGTTVVSIEPLMTWLPLHANMFSSMGHNYALVLGGADLTDPTVQKRWMTDVDAVIAFVKRL